MAYLRCGKGSRNRIAGSRRHANPYGENSGATFRNSHRHPAGSGYPLKERPLYHTGLTRTEPLDALIRLRLLAQFDLPVTMGRYSTTRYVQAELAAVFLSMTHPHSNAPLTIIAPPEASFVEVLKPSSWDCADTLI